MDCMDTGGGTLERPRKSQVHPADRYIFLVTHICVGLVLNAGTRMESETGPHSTCYSLNVCVRRLCFMCRPNPAPLPSAPQHLPVVAPLPSAPQHFQEVGSAPQYLPVVQSVPHCTSIARQCSAAPQRLQSAPLHFNTPTVLHSTPTSSECSTAPQPSSLPSKPNSHPTRPTLHSVILSSLVGCPLAP